MRKPSRLIRYTRSRGLKPLPKTSVSVWADAYRQLSAGISAEPGKWRTDRAPYQREIMDAFTQSGIPRVGVMSSSQIGKSDIMNNVIGRFAHLDPCAIMMVQPTIDMAEDFSKSRIAPMLRDTKVLTNLFFDVKTRDSNNTILSKIFPGGRLIMCGANSPAGLASRPVRVLLCDEVDRFPLSAGTEGAEEKLDAALALKGKLEKILEGEKPFDIFVRWKKLCDQPLGWEPDINDGVRLNIRPFCEADVLRENARKHNIKWEKDRGKDVDSAPWAKLFHNERINDHHLSLAEKKAARGEG